MPIRLTHEGDLPRILEIERAAFSSPWPVELLRGHLGEGGFWVYEQDGEVVGYILVGIKIPTLWERLEKRTRALVGQRIDLEERTGHIMNLAIDPKFHRRGLGSLLLQEGLRYLTELGADSVELEVRVNNDSAIQLYEKHGFHIRERYRHYYGNGDDAYRMVRSA
jgi:ribosomal-protein-alanine N-acetyltransferase